MNNNRKALFFLRHYNDIDHIVPVIYKWSRTGYDCTVVLIGFTNLQQDYRIQFISTLASVKVLDIQHLLTPKDQFTFRFISLLLYGRSSRYVSPLFYRLFETIWPIEKRRQFWDRLSRLLLNIAFPQDAQGVVVFDWISANSTLPLEFVQHMLLLCRATGLTSISLPHGDSPHFNELIRNHEIRIEPQTKYASSDIFDYIVCPNELCAKRYRPFISEHKIKVLGSARFNDEWLAVLPQLLPTPIPLKNQQELCVVFFLRKNEFSLFWDEIKRVITMLIQFDNVRLIIKPHTRDYLKKPLKNILNNIKSARFEIAKDDEHSASLISKADIIIDIATSVSFEAIKRGVPVLSADYLHAGYSAIAHYVPETAMRCRDDIYHAINSFLKNPKQQFYNTQHRNIFIQQMLDVPDKDVLARYINLLAEQRDDKQLAA